ncbi:hypothetical protein UP10_02580 [Bradyrhizobium sp. LTSPM299]|uniref:DUF4160 domain-containing protein n=1 Tax=Bradyrhizobium sp. LTSPM299 TaxID=1619233 RepID=UPI0005C8FFB4|nr:DUF4160 domain-containing protein [Bradyrhizobium sp. LTSPM299]KJC62592.1 hypothetical protein UP10_02580 [Bradyrhizobium sp. LTSPM299]
MARVHTIGKTIITVYANDHLPPHFHIVHPDFEALIVIEDFSVYAGDLKGPAGRSAIEWARANVAEIKAEWNRVNPRYPVK